MDLTPGTRVGDFTIRDEIGRGGFGVVYRATGPEGGTVAIKVAGDRHKQRSSRLLLQQQNEIEILRRIEHPSVVRLLGFGFLDDRRLYLVMEYVAGETLAAHLASRGRLETLEALPLARRIAEALAHCHDLGILHLDLKPSNIVLVSAAESRVRILDFGTGRLWHEGGGTGGVGTPVYMAPESFMGSESFGSQPLASTAKTDVYALGILLFELLAGRRPFDSTNLPALIMEKIQHDVTSLRALVPEVPAPVEALVNAMLAVDPDERPGAATVAGELRRLYFETLRGSEASSPEPFRRSGQSAFVGRGAELAHIHDALWAARDRGNALAFVGEAGIGKSRLVAEALEHHAAAAAVFRARCRHLGELIPYSCLREVLAHAAAWMSSSQVRDRKQLGAAVVALLETEGSILRALSPELDQLLPAPPRHGRGDDDAFAGLGADVVVRAMLRLLTLICDASPLVLVLEDLHWADEGTLAVLARLTAQPLPAGLVILCTSRPFDRLPALSGMQVVQVPPLGSEESADLLRTLTSAPPPLMAALSASIPLLGAGNPLMATQIVHNLEIEGYLARGEGGRLELCRSLGDYVLPDSVYRVLERTLERLDARSRDVLAVGALIDRQFRIEDVASVGGFSPAEVERALDVGERMNLCSCRDRTGIFAHDTVREQLERSVEEGRRRDIHRRIVDVLETREGREVGALAYHLEHAGLPLDAGARYFEAGHLAEQLHDPASAIGHFKRAIGLLVALPPGPRRDEVIVRSLHGLGRIASMLGDTDDVLAEITRCAAQLGPLTPAQALAMNSTYARIYYVRGDPRAMEFASRCAAAEAATPETRSYQSLPMNLIGRAHCSRGRFGPAADVLLRATTLAYEAGNYLEISHSEGMLGVSLGFGGSYAEAEKRLENCARWAQRVQDPVRIMAAHFYFSVLGESRFDWERGARESAQLLSEAEQQSLGGLYLYMGTLFAGRHQFHLGFLDRAAVLLENALRMAERLKIQMGIGWARAFLGDVHLVARRLDEARRAYADGLRASAALSGDEYAAPLCLSGQLHLTALEGGSPDAIRPLAEEALRRLRAVRNRSTELLCLVRYEEALRLAGDTPGAARVQEEKERLARALGVLDVVFWPRPPVEGGGRVASRDSWWSVTRDLSRPQADVSTASAVALVPTQATGTGRGERSLFENLSTVLDDLPAYLSHTTNIT
jgi:eukaryotic-like serine/threonine-protein kinase